MCFINENYADFSAFINIKNYPTVIGLSCRIVYVHIITAYVLGDNEYDDGNTC